MGISKAVIFHREVLSDQSGKCAICDKDMWLLHHIVPRCVDGKDDRENIVGLCASCHSRLHAYYNKQGLFYARCQFGDTFFHDCLFLFKGIKDTDDYVMAAKANWREAHGIR